MTADVSLHRRIPVNRFNPIDRTPSAYDFQLLVKQLLITPIARASQNEIVYRDKLRYGYPTFVERVSRLANVVTSLGAKPSQTVAVMDWDSHRYLECYFAIPMLGCVLQTVNVRLSPDQILYTLNHAGADVLIVNAEFLPILEGIRDKLETVKTFLLIDEAGIQPASSIEFVGEYEALMASAATHFDFPDFDENTRATTFYTSGTTGLPKGVYYSHRQLVLNTLATAATFGGSATQGRFHNEDVYMPITPLFHVHGWGNPYAATMMGVKQVYPGRYQYDLLLELIEKEKVTFSHCVPTILHLLLTHPKSKDTDLSRMKMLIGGSALPKGLAKMALDRGIDVFVGYGMSETGPIQVVNHLSTAETQLPLDQQAVLRTRTGRPAVLCDVVTLDEHDQPQPKDGLHSGEVAFRSIWTTQGYYKNPEASEVLWKGGWLHSGDIGSFGTDGVLQISDRVKDVIKTGGEWVSSLDLEDIISQHADVAEVAVIALKDPKWGERPAALVVPKTDAKSRVDVASIQAHVQPYVERGVICKYGVPQTVLFVEALEKTSVGKLDKKLLRIKYQDAV
jgi:fatty-acyl-CoA synthase